MVVASQVIAAFLLTCYAVVEKHLISSWADFWVFLLVFFAIYLVINVLYFVYLFIIGALPDKTKDLKTPSTFYQHEFKSANRYLIYHSGAKLHVTGKELIDEDQKYIFICNHKSNFDPMVLADAFPKNKMAFISKPENFNIPIAGGVAYKCGYVAIDRNDIRKGLEAINKASEMTKNNDLSMGIYPEGTRNETDELLLPFKNGAFKLAQKAELPIAVVTTKNTEMIAKNFPLKKTDVYIDVLKIIPKEEVKSKRTSELSEEVRNIMIENLSRYENADDMQKAMSN